MQAVDSPLVKGAATVGDLPRSLNSEMCMSDSFKEGGDSGGADVVPNTSLLIRSPSWRGRPSLYELPPSPIAIASITRLTGTISIGVSTPPWPLGTIARLKPSLVASFSRSSSCDTGRT